MEGGRLSTGLKENRFEKLTIRKLTLSEPVVAGHQHDAILDNCEVSCEVQYK